MIIDFHTHTFPDALAPRAIAKLEQNANIRSKSDGTKQGLLSHMNTAKVAVSVLLPIATKPEQTASMLEEVYRTNDAAASAEENSPTLISFGSLHPLNDNYKSLLRQMKEHQVIGIKLHPAYQGLPFDATPFLRIISYAQELGLYVLTHAGYDIGMPECEFACLSHILPALNHLDCSKLILAHMGGYGEWDKVEQTLIGSHVYLDTAFSPLPQAQLTRMIQKHGADRILFGTDHPWQTQTASIKAIQSLPLSSAETTAILGGNAALILNR